jgi:hypothetical protein
MNEISLQNSIETALPISINDKQGTDKAEKQTGHSPAY